MSSFSTRFSKVLTLLSLSLYSALAAADTQPPVVVALDADLSAVAAEGGEALRKGIEIALAEINEQGGLLGRNVILAASDHRGNPARGVKHIKQLVETDNLLAIFSGVHTPVVLAQLPLVHQHNKLFISPWAAGTSITNNGHNPNNVFRVSFRDEQVCQVLIATAKKRGINQVALILERTAWGRSNYQSLIAYAQQQGVDIVSIQWINWRQEQFDTEIKAIIESQAQGIILVANPPESVIVSRTLLASQNANLPILSHNGLAGGNFAQELGIDQLQQLNISVIQTFNFLKQDNPTARRLAAGYYKLYGKTEKTAIPAVVGLAHGYDSMHLLGAAVEQAHSFDTDKVRQALEQLSYMEGAVKNYTQPFSERDHEAFTLDDYFMTTFNSAGYLVPVTNK
ncbi:ABC transporter substrate-binding protein [Alteromonas sp. 14N.309.X.WAT.G.H12]|uniref:ABC transporter substrate-binding protein n=1 Tax=Alteromonas sp. 14N.309.X.WAT.G.H12 TaxID=3120824 RepID=UPI002FD36A20